MSQPLSNFYILKAPFTAAPMSHLAKAPILHKHRYYCDRIYRFMGNKILADASVERAARAFVIKLIRRALVAVKRALFKLAHCTPRLQFA